jgi:3D (Asp-Asp-Asp) domain-containing protein
MPPVAAALVVSTLLHAGSLGYAWAMPLTRESSVSQSSTAPVVRVVFEPGGRNDPSAGPVVRWVAPHAETYLWSASDKSAQEVGIAHLWAPLQVIGTVRNGRLPVWDPSSRTRAWVRAVDVGPVDPLLVGTAHLPPIGYPVVWGGPARVTMYTCVELGGCDFTASGIWPEPGVVAVDPNVIPLGSTVWIQGLGTFLAADTGSLVRGAHLDVYGLSHADAIEWGVQERTVLVYAPR